MNMTGGFGGNVGTMALMQALMQNNGNRGPINSMRDAYMQDMATDPSLRMGRSMLDARNPTGTTSGAVQQAMERLGGAFLTGMRSRQLREDANADADQMSKILMGETLPEGVQGATIPGGVENWKARRDAQGDNLRPNVRRNLADMEMRQAMYEPLLQQQADQQQYQRQRQQQQDARQASADQRAQESHDMAMGKARQEAAASEWLNNYMSGGMPQQAGRNVPIGIRNNNPLNLKNTPAAQQSGGGTYRSFNSMDDSWPAYGAQMQRYAERGIVTPRQIIQTWAPGSDGNDVPAYLGLLEKRGVDLDAPIDVNDMTKFPNLLSAMAKMEVGMDIDPKTIAASLQGGGKTGGGVPMQYRQGAPFPGGGASSMGAPVPGGGASLPRIDMTMLTLPGEAGARARDIYKLKNQEDAAQGKLDVDREKLAREDAKSAQKATERRDQELKYGNVVLDDVSRARGQAKDYVFAPNTGIGSVLDFVPGTSAHDLKNTLSSIKSGVSFQRLQEMRSASPTGGALGQVSDLENRKLESALGSLEQSQSEAQFLRNLDRVETVYMDIIHGQGNWSRGEGGTLLVGGKPWSAGAGYDRPDAAQGDIPEPPQGFRVLQ